QISSCAYGPSSRRLHNFFFQAEDGIRDFHVTGVQTCALPISLGGVVRADLDVDRLGLPAAVLDVGAPVVETTAGRAAPRRGGVADRKSVVYGRNVVLMVQEIM